MRMTPAFAAALLVLCGSAHTAKLTVDPNTAKPPPAESKPDERLALKVTCQLTGKRLHTVIDELSRVTGVAIRCGKSKDDWQVRDLPLVVCAKDVPLGALLKSIASATHLLLSSYRSEDGAHSYRIWRDASREKQLSDYFEKRKQAGLAKANWEWDAWAALGAVTDSQLQADPPKASGYESKSVTRVREFSKVMASLTPEQKQAVFSGERLRLRVGKLPPAVAAPIESMYRDWHESYRQEMIRLAQEHPQITPTDRVLTDADVKAAAKSDAGLPLAKLDSAYVTGVFRAAAEGANKDGDPVRAFLAAIRSRPGLEENVLDAVFRKHPELAGHAEAKEHVDEEELVEEVKAEFPELRNLTAIPVDAETISRLTLRIKVNTDGPRPAATSALRKHNYYMALEGEGINIHVPGPMLMFPVYSKAREAQLAKQATKQPH